MDKYYNGSLADRILASRIMFIEEKAQDITQFIRDYEPPVAVDEEEFKGDGKCAQDHGERTNYKLSSQPFYHRGRNGKMKGY